MSENQLVFSCPVLTAADPDFPVFVTQRAHDYLTNRFNRIFRLPAFQSIVVKQNDESRSFTFDYGHTLLPGQAWEAQVGKLRLVVPRDEAEEMPNGLVLDYGDWPPRLSGVTLNWPVDQTVASDPGKLRLSDALLKELHPEFYSPPPGLLARWQGEGNAAGQAAARDFLARTLHAGDTRAAVVVLTRPLVIACYTDDFDNVVLLRFPDAWAENAQRRHALRVGTRLVSVNNFEDWRAAPDLEKTDDSPQSNWTNFHPIIAHFVSEDHDRLSALVANIDEEEWHRCAELGATRLREGVLCRDGRPWLSALAAAWHRDIRYPHATYVPSRLES
jgi:hypothetical protein